MEDSNEARKLRVPYPAGRVGEKFTQGVANHTQRLVEENMARFIPPENVLRYRHGEGWSIRRADASAGVGSFKKMEILQLVHHEDFVNNDLGKLLEVVQGIIGEFNEKNEDLMVEATTDAAESVGNEVSVPEAGSWPEALLASLEKIKLTADRNGNVHMPQILVHPETGEKMRAELESQGPDYQKKVEALLHQKAAEAREEQRARLSNYEGFVASE